MSNFDTLDQRNFRANFQSKCVKNKNSNAYYEEPENTDKLGRRHKEKRQKPYQKL